MPTTLLTVSGEMNPQIEEKVKRGERPLPDYVAMGRGLPADLVDYKIARKLGRWVGRVLEMIGGPNLMLAWSCFKQRQNYQVLFTDGEQVGLPLALLLKFFGGRQQPKHCMIVHRISVRKKMIFLDLFRLHSHIDIFFVYSTWQGDFIRTRWKQSTRKVIYTPFMVDACFFSSEQVPINVGSTTLDVDSSNVPMLSAAGLEYRDYPALIEAVREVPVRAILAAASPWSKRHDTTTHARLPNNVIVRRFTQYELRQLYSASRFIVMPLYPVDYQAGVTAILEAMAMSKAVICTRTPGQTDVIVEGENGLYVDPNDPASMRSAIQWLLDHPQEADRMGRNGRRLVEQEMSLEQYVRRLARMIESLTSDGNIQ